MGVNLILVDHQRICVQLPGSYLTPIIHQPLTRDNEEWWQLVLVSNSVESLNEIEVQSIGLGVKSSVVSVGTITSSPTDWYANSSASRIMFHTLRPSRTL